MNPSIDTNPQNEGLRERNIAHHVNESISSSATSGQVTPKPEEDVEKEKKTFGRTPDGTSQFTYEAAYTAA
jgi:hypothetical protein